MSQPPQPHQPPPLPGQGTPAQPLPVPGGQAPADPPRDDLAMRHDTQATKTYPCAACGGELEFHIGQQRLVCPHCGNAQEITTAGLRPVAEQDFEAAQQSLRDHAATHQQLVTGEKEVVCQNCGGHTTFSGTLTSERCPYCATPIQRDDVHDAPARLPVDGILPFTIDRKVAEDKLKEWVSSRWFAPGEFKRYSRAGSFESVYVAYYTFDMRARTQYEGQRGDDYQVTVGSGENERTETRTDWSPARGVVTNSWNDLMVFANKGIDRDHLSELEPWPLQDVVPYSPQYVAGHLARTYDMQLDGAFTSVQQRVRPEIERTIKADIGGDRQKIHKKNTVFSDVTYKHLLIPLWLLTVIYGGQNFQVLINGRTGYVAGERPWSRVKVAFAVALTLLVIGFLVYYFFLS